MPAVASFFAVAALFTAVIWGVSPAGAQEVPPAPTTTTIDAPPPDPYTPPARAKPKAKPSPAPRRTAPAAPVRSYTPPAQVTPRPAVQSSTPKPQRKAKVVRKQKARSAPVRRKAKPAQIAVTLAPLENVLAAVAVEVPVAAKRGDDDPYLWLAGISFAVLAVAGTTLLMLTTRFFRLGWQ